MSCIRAAPNMEEHFSLGRTQDTRTSRRAKASYRDVRSRCGVSDAAHCFHTLCRQQWHEWGYLLFRDAAPTGILLPAARTVFGWEGPSFDTFSACDGVAHVPCKGRGLDDLLEALPFAEIRATSVPGLVASFSLFTWSSSFDQ